MPCKEYLSTHHKNQEYARSWKIGCKVQKTNKSEILSFGWVFDIIKWLKRCGLKDQLELSGNAIKYVIIEDRLLEALRMKWQDAKMSKLEYHIANINP